MFRVKAGSLATFGHIMSWLAQNGTSDQYETRASHGCMNILFKDEAFAVQCKLVWSEYLELL